MLGYENTSTLFFLGIYSTTINLALNTLKRKNNLLNIRAADYLINGKLWYLKEIKGDYINTIYNTIKKSKNQSQNLIIDMTNTTLTDYESNEIINKILKNSYIVWVKRFILIKDTEILYDTKK